MRTLRGKEPILDLIIEILSIELFNIILYRIDLKANDSMNSLTTRNINICIDIAENTQTDCLNVRERYFKDEHSPAKSAVSPRFRPILSFLTIYRTDRILQATQDEASPIFFSSSTCPRLFLFRTTMLAKIHIALDFVSQDRRFLLQNESQP